MRQGPNNKRMRGRGNGRKQHNPRNSSFESNGPDVKVRGNAQQVVEKYLALARDASSAGDRIAAESYYQHAEHYYRVLNANQPSEQRGNTPNADMNNMDDDTANEEETADTEEAAASENAPKSGRSNGSRRRNNKGNGGNRGNNDPAGSPQPEVEAVAFDEPAMSDTGEGLSV